MGDFLPEFACVMKKVDVITAVITSIFFKLFTCVTLHVYHFQLRYVHSTLRTVPHHKFGISYYHFGQNSPNYDFSSTYFTKSWNG